MRIVIKCKNDKEKQAAMAYLSAVSGRKIYSEIAQPRFVKDTFEEYPHVCFDPYNPSSPVQGYKEIGNIPIPKENKYFFFERISDCLPFVKMTDVKIGDTVFTVNADKVDKIMGIIKG
jgi:hypothetical protein